MRIITLLLILTLIPSCVSLYTGSYKLADFSVKNQPDQLGEKVEKWEDGLRTKEKKNKLEWWYFDGKLSDGAIVVCYFWKVHFLVDQYFIGFNYSKPGQEDIFKIKYFKSKDVTFLEDSCDVRFGENFIIGNLEKYKIRIEPNDFDGLGFDVILESQSMPYRPQDGVIKAGNDFFAWLAAVPKGSFKGHFFENGNTIKIQGAGYHDHNWGNTPLQKLFKSWLWFRGEAGPYTVIASELNTLDHRGGYDIPILYIAQDRNVIVNRFGQDGLFTKKSELIENVYRKKNEPLFSNLELLTTDGFLVNIKGKKIIDNTLLFDRAKTPIPLSKIMNTFNIDPHYTRFQSDLSIRDSLGNTFDGYGVLELMDLK